MPALHGTTHGPRHGAAHGPNADLATAPDMLVVLFGQSNSIGLCVAANETAYGQDLTVAYPAVQIKSHNEGAVSDPLVWVDEGPRDLAPRTVSLGGSYVAGTNGIELVLGRELDTRTANKWFVSSMGVDGSSLVTHWNNASFPASPPALLSQFTTYVQDTATGFGISNVASQVILVWIQGEADTGQTYATYLSNMQSFFTSIRGTLGNVKVIVHRLTPKVDNLSNVRAAEESWVFADDTVNRITYADDQPLRDAFHYTDNAYTAVGIRVADVIVNLVGGGAQTSPRWAGQGPWTVANSTSGITPTMPTHQTNDILLFVVSALGNTNYPLGTPNGFAEVANSPQHDSGNALNARLHVWWKRAASSAESAPVMSDVAGDDFKIGGIVAIRGCTTSGDPWDVTAGDTAATSTSVSCPSVTTTVTNTFVLAICADRVDLSPAQFSGWANSNLTSVTELVNVNTLSGAGFGVGIAGGYKGSAGATGATTATLANTSTQARLTIALKA